MAKLELAIIENLQREDLNAVERARAFMRLAEEFKFTHAQIGAKVGKSREYVSNTLRLLSLPQEVLDALSAGKITEGHTRPIMMLVDRPEEQMVLFKEIMFKKINVRDAEKMARKVAVDRVRKKEYMPDPEISMMEEKLQETLGTRVHIEKGAVGGQITIDFFSNEDLATILDMIKSNEKADKHAMFKKYEASQPQSVSEPTTKEEIFDEAPIDDRTKDEIQKSEEEADLYNISNFSL
jgi:ParB family chromosome partitioning protein